MAGALTPNECSWWTPNQHVSLGALHELVCRVGVSGVTHRRWLGERSHPVQLGGGPAVVAAAVATECGTFEQQG